MDPRALRLQVRWVLQDQMVRWVLLHPVQTDLPQVQHRLVQMVLLPVLHQVLLPVRQELQGQTGRRRVRHHQGQLDLLPDHLSLLRAFLHQVQMGLRVLRLLVRWALLRLGQMVLQVLLLPVRQVHLVHQDQMVRPALLHPVQTVLLLVLLRRARQVLQVLQVHQAR